MKLDMAVDGRKMYNPKNPAAEGPALVHAIGVEEVNTLTGSVQVSGVGTH